MEYKLQNNMYKMDQDKIQNRKAFIIYYKSWKFAVGGWSYLVGQFAFVYSDIIMFYRAPIISFST